MSARTDGETIEPRAGDVWRAPSGVEFQIVAVDGGTVTVDTHRLADGSLAQLENIQEYSRDLMRVADGWQPVEGQR